MKCKSAVLLFLFLAMPVMTQAGSSIYGFGPNSLGTYQYPYSTAALGRGGMALAMVDSMSLNLTNFATWSRLSLTTFTLNMEYQGLNITSQQGSKLNLTDGNFKGGYVAWPLIARKLAMGLGLSPVVSSDLGVKISNIGVGSPASQTVESKGTISAAKVIFSYRVSDNFSISLTPNFNFGIITDQIKIRYNNLAYGNLNIENKYQVYGVGAELGAYYDNDKWFAIGARVKIPSKMTVYSTQKSLAVEKTIEEYRDLRLPLAVAAGIVLRPGSRVKIGADVDFQNWKDGYQLDSKRIPGIQNSFRLGAGLERGPVNDRFASYFQKMTLRAGAFYAQLNNLANGNPVNEYGLTFGLGMPIIMNRSQFDLSAEVGQRGDINLNFIEEMFFRIGFSVSANELWFVQQDR